MCIVALASSFRSPDRRDAAIRRPSDEPNEEKGRSVSSIHRASSRHGEKRRASVPAPTAVVSHDSYYSAQDTPHVRSELPFDPSPMASRKRRRYSLRTDTSMNPSRQYAYAPESYSSGPPVPFSPPRNPVRYSYTDYSDPCRATAAAAAAPATASNPSRPPQISRRQASAASAGSLLGDIASGMTEFELFNGELLESDIEEAGEPPSPSGRDPFRNP